MPNLKNPIINHRKPGELWRFMLKIRTACLMVMTPELARSHIGYRCREMRRLHELRSMTEAECQERDEKFLNKLSSAQGW